MGWSAISRNAAAFESRYAKAYQQHHKSFHDPLPRFRSYLTAARKQLSALGLLNNIVEIASPQRIGLDDPLAALGMGPSPCCYLGSEIALFTDPLCPEYQISLTQKVPTAELAQSAPQIELAFGSKTQDLSRRLLEKTLAGQSDER